MDTQTSTSTNPFHVLKIKILDDCPNRENVLKFYNDKAKNISHQGDSGVDLICPDDCDFMCNRVTRLNLGISCEFIPANQVTSGGFFLAPRSSISGHPLQMTNSFGVFDAGYRGPVIAALRCFMDRDHPTTIDNFYYSVTAGTRLVQIIAPDLKPIQIQIVDELTTTDRGNNGFGSTGISNPF